MGASARSVMYIFMLQGLIIGSIGTAIGAVAGVGVSWVMNRYQLLRVPGMGEVYQISYVPFTLLPFESDRRRRDGRADLLPRDDLSVAPGGEAEAGRSAPIRIGSDRGSWSTRRSRSQVMRPTTTNNRSTSCSDDRTMCAAFRTAAPRKSLFPKKIAGTLLDVCVRSTGGMTMRTLFGAVAGALAVGAMLVSYNLGERDAFSRDLMRADHADDDRPGWHRAAVSGAGGSGRHSVRPCRGSRTDGRRTARSTPGAVAPMGYAGVSGVSAGAVSGADRSTSPSARWRRRRCVACIDAAGRRLKCRPRRSWQKSALLIGGSAGAGAGVGR